MEILSWSSYYRQRKQKDVAILARVLAPTQEKKCWARRPGLADMMQHGDMSGCSLVQHKYVFTCFHPPFAKAALCLSMQWDLLGAGAVLVSQMICFNLF